MTAVYQVLVLRHDWSVIEVGGWRQRAVRNPPVFTAAGYKDRQGRRAGLVWSPPGGLGRGAAIHELEFWSMAKPKRPYKFSGSHAYSRVGLVEVLPEYTPPYGRCDNGRWAAGCGRTYKNVAHIVMYHGTRDGKRKPARCWYRAPVAADGAYYAPFKDYDSYAIDLFLTPSRGVIEHRRPFFERDKGNGICRGSLFGDANLTLYIDE